MAPDFLRQLLPSSGPDLAVLASLAGEFWPLSISPDIFPQRNQIFFS
jgi:hypothetical protein